MEVWQTEHTFIPPRLFSHVVTAHDEEFAADVAKYPALQLVQTEDPTEEYVPPAQRKQASTDVAPVVGEYVPEMQFEHKLEPIVEYVPALHAKHACPDA